MEETYWPVWHRAAVPNSQELDRSEQWPWNESPRLKREVAQTRELELVVSYIAVRFVLETHSCEPPASRLALFLFHN